MAMDSSIYRAVYLHAEANTHADGAEFTFTPTQAALAFWGLQLLARHLSKIEPVTHALPEFADELRCRADAIEWASNAMLLLAKHAESHNVRVCE